MNSNELDISTTRKIYSAFFSIFIIVFSGLGICEPCFILHVYPWAVGFAEGFSYIIIIYYIGLFILLYFFIYLIIRLRRNKNDLKRNRTNNY